MSGHVYADMGSFRRLLSGGDASRDAEMLTVLESSSRAVDAFCNRGSGFGPVIETRHYTSHRSHLHLAGDLLAIDAMTVNGDDIDPLPEITSRTRRLSGFRGDVAITGPWSYDYQLVPIESYTGTIADDATTLTLAATVSEGQHLLLDDEQVLVLAVDGDEATILRGVNGTEAAEHVDPVVNAFRYDAAVVDATGRVALRRWRQRDAGLTGIGGGPDMPMSPNVDTEWSILLSTVSHLRFLTVDGR